MGKTAAPNDSKRDPIDDILEKQDGLIKRGRDPKLYVKSRVFFKKKISLLRVNDNNFKMYQNLSLTLAVNTRLRECVIIVCLWR